MVSRVQASSKKARSAVLLIVTALLPATCFVPPATPIHNGDEAPVAQSTTISPARVPIFREAEHTRAPSGKAAEGVKKDATLGQLVEARLMKEIKEICRCESHRRGIIEVELVNDNIREWHVKLFIPDMREDFVKLKAMGREDHIMLQVSFGDDYPAGPPFVRVVYPILFGPIVQNHEGALCMDVLFGRNWDSSYTAETLILTILSGLVEKKVRPNWDKIRLGKSYSEEDAREIFENLKRGHKDDF